MRPSDWLRLIILAAIWGGSFVFMRVVAPALGPLWTANLRLLIAGAALVAYLLAIGTELDWKRHAHHYLAIGVINSGIPFSLYAFAARHLPASYLVILNSTAPLFGAVFGALWLKDALSPRKLVGLLLGAAGVSLVARVGPVKIGGDPYVLLSILACLGAACCYALAGVYMGKYAKGIKPAAIAAASQLLAGLALLPLAVATRPQPVAALSTKVTAALLTLALLCSGIAYLLYYPLLAEVGPSRALTVTFLMPVFGVLWGTLFLDEKLTAVMLAGCGLVIVGTMLVVRRGAALPLRPSPKTPQ